MFSYLKSSIINGLVILVPLVLVFLAIKEVMELMIGMATPLAHLFPEGVFNHVKQTEIIAGLLIVGVALVLGMLSKLKIGRAVGRSIENHSLNKVPMYRMLKSLVGAYLHIETDGSFKPALLETGNGQMEPCYVIEDRGGPRVVVMMPWTPKAFEGSIRLVPRDCVYYLKVTLDEFSESLTHMGVGLSELLPEHVESAGDGR